MTDLDFDRLGDLWRQRPTEQEMEALRRSADAVRRRAQRGQIVEAGLAVIVAVIVIFLVLTNPTTEMVVVGAGAILILLLSLSRNRRLRAEELQGLTGSAEQMLDQSVSRAKATLKRMRLQLLGIGPSFILGLGIAALADRSSGTLYARIISHPDVGLLVLLGGLACLALGAVAFVRSIRSTRGELSRLIQLRSAFREERGETAADR